MNKVVYLTVLLSCITNIKPTEAGEGSTRAGVSRWVWGGLNVGTRGYGLWGTLGKLGTKIFRKGGEKLLQAGKKGGEKLLQVGKRKALQLAGTTKKRALDLGKQALNVGKKKAKLVGKQAINLGKQKVKEFGQKAVKEFEKGLISDMIKKIKIRLRTDALYSHPIKGGSLTV